MNALDTKQLSKEEVKQEINKIYDSDRLLYNIAKQEYYLDEYELALAMLAVGTVEGARRLRADRYSSSLNYYSSLYEAVHFNN